MATCIECEAEFDVADARRKYHSEPDVAEDEYDELHGGEWCADCAAVRAEGLANVGIANLMMMGEVEYDDDHVQKYL
ncbi:hypothetical protein [Streptomyces sp. NPDC059874]|uniref:hypothetical protein n=1 Tax=Streptomyces sp. NPDC059874 TaxID=3346983 RepID=UPI00364AE18A